MFGADRSDDGHLEAHRTRLGADFLKRILARYTVTSIAVGGSSNSAVGLEFEYTFNRSKITTAERRPRCGYFVTPSESQLDATRGRFSPSVRFYGRRDIRADAMSSEMTVPKDNRVWQARLLGCRVRKRGFPREKCHDGYGRRYRVWLACTPPRRRGTGFRSGPPARSSAEPQGMYVELAKQCPVVRNDNGVVTLLTMDDILFVNKHRQVEQASKFLGSNRPAIPLGLDGPGATHSRRLLDPVFTAKRVAPLADQVRALANKLIDGFIDAGEVKAYHDWCEPLPSQIFLSIMGLPMEDLPASCGSRN